MAGIQKVAVLGAGTMGSGIAQVSAAAGCDVALFDISEEAVGRGVAQIEHNLTKGIEKGKVSRENAEATLGRLRQVTSIEEAVRDADCVVEAVPESLDLKKSIFEQVCRAAPPDALLGTNTSSLPVSEIAAAATHPERVVGLHFFNPVHIMKLLEIIRGVKTSDATIERARDFAAQLSKEAIVIQDTPGFATSRLGVLLGLEAIRMLEAGVGSAEDIDRAMVFGYRHPMGPLRLTDLVGLDVRLSIAEHLHTEIGSQFAPPELLRTLVAEGKLGKKSGQGFYRWEP